jgi:2'-deoxynucleoside 5'-phosphate N-hydrolase
MRLRAESLSAAAFSTAATGGVILAADPRYCGIMRVYLACTVRGDRGGVLAGRAICERLQHHGHHVLTTHLLANGVDDAESRLTETQVFRRDLEWLSGCDALVAEASGSSYGVGFEVGYVLGRARGTGQRVVLVYDASRRPSVSRLITGNCDAACTTFGYTSLEELRAFVDRHFSTTNGASDATRTMTG